MKTYKAIFDEEVRHFCCSGKTVRMHKNASGVSRELAELYPQFFIEEDIKCVIKDNEEDLKKDITEEWVADIKEEVEKVKEETKEEVKKVEKETNNNFQATKNKKSSTPVIAFIAVFVVALLSGLLRLQGITSLFAIDIFLGIFIVLATIFVEFAIAKILLELNIDLKTKILTSLSLISIQLVLIAFSFTLEFSAISNILFSKDSNVIVETQKMEFILTKKNELENSIQTYQKELDTISEKRVILRNTYLNNIEKLRKERKALDSQYENMLNQKGETVVKKSPIQNSANAFGITADFLVKIISFGVAMLLNVLYLILMYAGIKIYNNNETN